MVLVFANLAKGNLPPLFKVSAVVLPGQATRFDYESLDPESHRLYLSHMGAGRVVIFNTKANRVEANLPGYPTVTGVLAVPQIGKFYASATGSHEVVVTEMRSNKIIARIKGAGFPDGIAYVPSLQRIFVSDEAGGRDLVINAVTNRRIGMINLGGKAGNTHYDPTTKRIWVAVQTRNQMAEIDPRTLKVIAKYATPGGNHPHGWISYQGTAYISCDGNNKLLVANLKSMKVRQVLPVTSGPDVLAIEKGLHLLYVACEGGAVDVFKIARKSLVPLGKFMAPDAHTIAVDQTTHRVYIALENIKGRPELWTLVSRL